MSSNALGLIYLSNLFYLGLNWPPRLYSLGLTCLSDSRYLELDWLSRLYFLGSTYLLDSRYLELGWLPSPNSLVLTYLPDPIGLGRLPNPSVLHLIYLLDPFYSVKIFIKILTKFVTHESYSNQTLAFGAWQHYDKENFPFSSIITHRLREFGIWLHGFTKRKNYHPCKKSIAT